MFRRVFLHTIMDKSAEGGLKSIGNTMTVRKKSSTKQGTVVEIPMHLILSFFVQPCPGPSDPKSSVLPPYPCILHYL